MQDFCREKTTELRERSIICAVFFLFFFLCFIPLPFPPISGRRSLLLPSVMGILSKMLFNLQKKGVADGLCKPGGSQKRGGEQKKIPNSHLFNGSVSLSCSEKKTFFFFLAGHMLDWFVCRVSVLDASQIVSPLQKRTVNTRQWFLKKYYISAVYLPFANLRIYCTTLF